LGADRPEPSRHTRGGKATRRRRSRRKKSQKTGGFYIFIRRIDFYFHGIRRGRGEFKPDFVFKIRPGEQKTRGIQLFKTLLKPTGQRLFPAGNDGAAAEKQGQEKLNRSGNGFRVDFGRE